MLWSCSCDLDQLTVVILWPRLTRNLTQSFIHQIFAVLPWTWWWTWSRGASSVSSSWCPCWWSGPSNPPWSSSSPLALSEKSLLAPKCCWAEISPVSHFAQASVLGCCCKWFVAVEKKAFINWKLVSLNFATSKFWYLDTLTYFDIFNYFSTTCG